MKKNQKTTLLVISLIAVLALLFGCPKSDVPPSTGITEAQTREETVLSETKDQGKTETKEDPLPGIPDGTPDTTAKTENPEASTVGAGKEVSLSVSDIPPFSGTPYAIIQNNVPNFSAKELKSKGYESYSSLDALGRTRGAIASVGKDTIPKEGEKRGSISSIRPSGWVQAQYDHISGKYLYNRCHLIGWQLSAENANARNLITGTKYLNVSGMLPFENMVADYIKETGNHVAYRITPIYDGDNLLPYGVEMEAYSVEDSGEGISFHIFCYNVQPGVHLNYADGSSSLPAPAPVITTTAPPPTTTAPVTTGNTNTQNVFITKSGKRYHSTRSCRGLNNAKSVFEVSLSEAQGKGLTPCSICY